MADRKQMTDAELLSLIHAYEENSIGNSANASGVGIGSVTPQGVFDLTTVEIDRYNALNYYAARPFGNEQTDRSQVVIPMLRDTVEWLLPQLMRMFAGTSRICSFDPVKPGDEQLAEQETDVVNYVFLKQNNGFNLLYDAFKDALLLKNYYFKVGWEKRRHTSIEPYSGLTKDELTKIFMDAKEDGDELEVIAQDTRQILVPAPEFPPMQPQQMTPGQNPQMPPPGMPIPLTVYDVKLRRVTMKGQVVVECCPPEEMRVSSRARSDMDHSPFTAQVTRPTRSELIEMGFDQNTVYGIPRAKPRWVEMDQLARDSSLDEMTDQDEADPSTTEVEVKECYLKVDYDGDGVAELRRVLVGGNVVLENEEVPFVAFSSGVPCRMSHRHVGVSIYDLMGYLQQVYSMLFRQGMDETYLSTNTRVAVNNQTVNLDDLLTNRPGGIVRVNGSPQADIMPMPTGSGVAAVGPLMEIADRLRTMHTGVGENTLGLDPDSMQNITNPNGQAMLSSAQLKIEMIALLLGDGLKDLFRKIHALLIMHQDQKLDVQLRGEWIEADPSQWKSRTSVTLNVGLGSGNRQELRNNAMALSAAQAQAAQMGLVGPKQAYNTAVKLLEGLGWENGRNTYFMSPDSPEFAQAQASKAQAAQAAQQNNPALAVAMFKAKSDQDRLNAESQRDARQTALQAQKDSQEAQTETALRVHEMEQEAQIRLRAQAAESLLNFIEGIAVAAIKANAQPATIETDVMAAAQAGRQVQ